jgi:hypothetical protein
MRNFSGISREYICLDPPALLRNQGPTFREREDPQRLINKENRPNLT